MERPGSGLSSRGKEATRLPFRNQVICRCAGSLAFRFGGGACLRGGFGETSAGLLDLLTGGLADLVEADIECLLNLAIAEELDLITRTIDKTRLAQGFLVDERAGFETIVKIADVYDNEDIAEVEVVETALGQTAMEGHLTAFETDAGTAAGTGFLTLVAFAGGLTETRAFARTKTFGAMLGTGIRL